MKIIKNLGRSFLIVTEEERYIKSEDIKAVLFIGITSQLHYRDAMEKAVTRFGVAQFIEITAGSRMGALKRLWRMREEQFSAVIILDLDPFIMTFVYLLFHCYLILYNRYGQWFLIRRKTPYELLSGRRGADRPDLDWKIPQARMKLARFFTDLASLFFITVRNTARGLGLILYILCHVTFLYARKAYYSSFR